MIEISFLCMIYNLGEEDYEDKYFGKLRTGNVISENVGLDKYIKDILEECLIKFNNECSSQLVLDGISILGVIENYYTSDDDKECFDVYIDHVNNYLYLLGRRIDI